MILKAKAITFGYHHRPPLFERLNLTVATGERVGLTAPSGGGKTTLCRLLAGYLQPRHGQILLGGNPLPAQGYCPVQLIHQHPEKAVDPRLKMKHILAEGGPLPAGTMEDLGIEPDWLHRYPQELSGGELQRFCIARALNPATRFIIADEISAMLDMITQAQVWAFLLRISAERQLGMIIVSHQPALLDRLCTRTIAIGQEG